MPPYPKQVVLNKIKYESPSGFVNVGKYIPPFEKVKNGFGYMGVVVEDYESGKLQCHICGEWFEIFNFHLKNKHGINSNEYKERFGLSKSTALLTKKIRLKQSKVMIELNKTNPKCFNRSHFGFEKNNKFASNRKNKPKSAETKNKYGVCDLQIADRLLKLKDKLGKTPTLIDLKEEYGAAFIFHIHKRHQSYIKLCRQLKLEPNYSNYNPKYSKEYFIEKGLSNEPTHRILTINEGRYLYKYFKGGVKEWKKAIQEVKKKNGIK